METFTKFLYEFLGQFFSGVGMMFSGIWKGLQRAVDIKSYTGIIDNYKNDFSMPEWALVVIAIGLLLLIFVLIGLLIFFTINLSGMY